MLLPLMKVWRNFRTTGNARKPLWKPLVEACKPFVATILSVNKTPNGIMEARMRSRARSALRRLI